jgi:eukaryotic-like serine/threonine-protein kinase
LNPSHGTILGDRYTLTERIAAGGMGEVWAATDTVLGRTVAVKLLNPALVRQAGFLARFRAEARCTAALHHPNITTMLDCGEDEDSAYLVMELVIGQPLSEIVAQRAPLSPQETVTILIQAASALEAAHQGGVVHRDVKPANILITADGTVKLTDFGISRMVDTAPLTQTGEILGTAQYLSPEQALGQNATAQSDVYALGVVGYEMLTAHRPFEAETMVATALAHINQPPPQLPDTVPAGIRDLIGAALAKDPADRPAGAAAMARALRMPAAVSSGGDVTRTQVIPIGAAALSAPAKGSLPARVRPARRRTAIILGAATAIAIGVLAAFALPDGGNDLRAPAVIATTPPTSSLPDQTLTSATLSTNAASVAAPPANTSPSPGQLDRPRGKARSHDDNKDGKK